MMRHVSPNRFARVVSVVEIKIFRNIFFFQNEISKVDKGDKGGISYKSQNIVNQKSRKKKKKWNNTTDKDRK